MMSVDDALPWTTSRCNRLLRPLSSKLAKLRKELERPRSAGGEPHNASLAFATKGSPQKTTNFTRPALKPRGFDKARDPDWRPGVKPGAGKKTYGGRGVRKLADLHRSSSEKNNFSRPGEIAFTPLIARMGGQLHSSPVVQMSPLKKYGKNRGPLAVDVEQIRAAKTLPADLHRLVQGLSEAYANILQATMTGDEKRWRGTRSLMSGCLRKLPAYIELEEHFAKLDKLEEEEEIEDQNIANEIYEHLEVQFEQRAGLGWRPFRQVVRAHGTSLVCDAITDELLGLESLSVLVTHCLNVSAWDEAERLILAYVPLLQALSFPINLKADLFDAQRRPYLSLLKGFVDRTGRYRLLFDLLEHMVALELLPLEWLATECIRPVWDRLVRTISEHDNRTFSNAFRFMETATLASMGLPDIRLLEDEITGSIARRFVPSSREELRMALNTTFSSLLTVLCSVALVNNSRDDDAGKTIARRVTWALDSIIVTLATREDIRDELRLLDADIEDVQAFAQRALWVNFASFFIHLEGGVDPTMLSLDLKNSDAITNKLANDYAETGINFASVLSGLPTLIASIARGTGRIWQDDGFDQLQRLVATLMGTSGFRLPHKLWTLKRLALESAMEFACGTGDVEHMAFAREIEETMRLQGRLVIKHSPEKNTSPTASGGFRWEEGIGEWVACTPFTKQNAKRQQRKAVRALELLPTPVQSEDEIVEGTDRRLPGNNDSSMWETTAFDFEDDDAIPPSSPIKKAPRASISSLGKRIRATSPRVVILAKRLQMTPPDTPDFKFYPILPDDTDNDGTLRRSSRSRQDVEMLTSRSRTQRSRTSLESGLRSLRRPVYIEPDVANSSDVEESQTSEDESNASPALSEDAQNHTRPSSRKHSQHTRHNESVHDAEGEEDDDEDDGEASEHDELSKTPAALRSRTLQNVKNSKPIPNKNKEWWKIKRSFVNDSEEEGSEDELSFQ